MSDDIVTVRGFRPFISLWYDATDQILTESDPDKLNNDIRLFEILRNIMLTPEKPIFVRSYKLNDFNRVPDIQKQLNYQNKNIARLTWASTRQPSMYGRRPNIKVAPNIPSPISYCGIRNTKMFSMSNRTVIRNNCIFKREGIFSQPAKKTYTVIDNNNFIANIEDVYVLYNVSEKIMSLVAKNARNNINLDTFQELTAKMYAQLQEQQQKYSK